MWKKISVLLIFFFCIVGVCYGGNTSEHTYIPNEYYSDIDNVEVVYADADGHFNIPFSDGSYGYCLEYMEEEAVKGDVFIVANTSYAVNNRTGEDVSNLLKVYFIDYGGYKDTDSVRVQHMIWHFTDDFDGWRVNKTLVDDIKETAEYKKLPDSAVLRYNSTHNMGYKFNSFISPFSNHQNYWGYDVWFELINSCKDEIVNNYTYINNSFYYNNYSYFNETNNLINIYNTDFNKSYYNYTLISFNDSHNPSNIHYYIIYLINNSPTLYYQTYGSHNHNFILSDYPTSNELIGIGIIVIILIGGAIYLKIKK